LAHFLLRIAQQKTALSAPIFFAAAPQKRISASIACAPGAGGRFSVR
jgi:hypothetical protein